MFTPSQELRKIADALRPALGLDGGGEMPGELVEFANSRHRVAPLLAHAAALGGTRADAATQNALAAEAQRSAVRSLRQRAAALSFGKLLDQGGIEHCEIKGSRLGELLYGGDSLRHSKDVDILIAPGGIDAAIDRVISAGYRDSSGRPLRKRKVMAILRFHREVEVRDPSSGVTLELHSRVLQNPPEGWSDAGMLVPSLDLSCPLYVLYLILHGAEANWQRLKMQADLAMLARLVKPDARVQVARLARQFDCAPALAASFRLCGALWGEEIVQPWLRELAVPDADERVAAHAAAYQREINRTADMPSSELILRRLDLLRDAPTFGARQPSRLPLIRDRAALWLMRKF